MAAPSSSPPKKEMPLLVSFLILASSLAACLGCGYLAMLVLTPPLDRLMVYRHHTDIPGESCGDDFDKGPNPYADNFSYWADNDENTDFTCQAQQTIMQLKKPPAPTPFDDTAFVTDTMYTGGNQKPPSLDDIQTMEYTGFLVEATITLLPNTHITQSGISLHLDLKDTAPLTDPPYTYFFLVDNTGLWHIATYDTSDYLNELVTVGDLKQELASGRLQQQKQQYFLQVRADARRGIISFLIDGSLAATVRSFTFDTYNTALTLVCPIETTPTNTSGPNLCPVALSNFTFDVIH